MCRREGAAGGVAAAAGGGGAPAAARQPNSPGRGVIANKHSADLKSGP
jgi:hypothetical protein